METLTAEVIYTDGERRVSKGHPYTSTMKSDVRQDEHQRNGVGVPFRNPPFPTCIAMYFDHYADTRAISA